MIIINFIVLNDIEHRRSDVSETMIGIESLRQNGTVFVIIFF